MKTKFILPIAVLSFSLAAPSLHAQDAPPAPAAPAPAAAAETPALDLLPGELTNAKGEKVSKDSLKGKIVGLYFSAHWCGPCRAFTPELVKFRDENAANFEIVFVSSDKSADDMKKYMEETKMQWLALPYGNPAKAELSKRFQIRGIPSLIILGADGKLITKNGRADVARLKNEALAAWKK